MLRHLVCCSFANCLGRHVSRHTVSSARPSLQQPWRYDRGAFFTFYLPMVWSKCWEKKCKWKEFLSWFHLVCRHCSISSATVTEWSTWKRLMLPVNVGVYERVPVYMERMKWVPFYMESMKWSDRYLYLRNVLTSDNCISSFIVADQDMYWIVQTKMCHIFFLLFLLSKTMQSFLSMSKGKILKPHSR